MKRYLRMLLIYALAIGFLYPCVGMIAKAVIPGEDTYSGEEKIQCTATIEDDFADNSVIVVLSNDVSVSLKKYEISDFSEVACKKINDLTSVSTKLVEAKLIGKDISEQFGSGLNSIVLDDFYDINTETFHRILYIELAEPSKENVLRTIKTLIQRDDVVYAGPNYSISVCSTKPGDPYINEQWAVNTIQLPEAWDIETGEASVLVGVLDTGIDASHEDLKNRVNLSLSRDCNGTSANVVSSVSDSHWHGTHVAGIIGAQGDNKAGISGVAWNIKLVSLQVFGSDGTGSLVSVHTAVQYAIQKGIPILNYSGGAASNYADLYYAIQNYNGLFVCAAGNENSNNDESPIYPSNYNLSNLISVGASSKSDTIWYDDSDNGSNYGATTVDLFAPGDEILSCYINSQYATATGTSMAAPHVTGVAALMLSANPNMTAAQIKTKICADVDKLSAFSGYCSTGGRLNAYKALHSHSYSCVSQNASKHACTCSCGKSYLENHTWDSYEAVVNNIVVTFCTKCGYTKSTTTTSSL